MHVHVCKYVAMYLSVYVSVRSVSLVCLCDCVSVCLYVRVGDDAGSRAWVVGSSGYKASTHWTPIALVELDWFFALQNLLAEAR